MSRSIRPLRRAAGLLLGLLAAAGPLSAAPTGGHRHAAGAAPT